MRWLIQSEIGERMPAGGTKSVTQCGGRRAGDVTALHDDRALEQVLQAPAILGESALLADLVPQCERHWLTFR